MLPGLKNTTFFPSWVDELAGPMWPDLESKVGASMPAVNIHEDEGF